MSTRKDILRRLADARPGRLDPGSDGRRADPATIMAHPQQSIGAARAVRRPARRLVLAGLVPAVALVAAGGAFLTVGTGGSGAGTGGAPATGGPAAVNTSPVPQTARDLFLVAAERSLSNPETNGRYWVLNQEHGEATTVGPEDRPYQVMRRSGQEQWLAMTPDGESLALFQDLGAAPISAEDQAAWKADGSPTEWTQLPPRDVPDPKPVVIRSAPGPRFSGPARPMPPGGIPNDDYFIAGGQVSLAELGALPTDPGGLKAWLLDKMETGGAEEPTDYNLFWNGKTIIFDLPVTPQVRAAAYRMLADVQGVTSLGMVTDQAGRTGMAVAYARKGDGGNWGQARLIIDPQTGQALAEESWDLGQGKAPAATGTLMQYALVLSAGYSNDTPPTDGATPQE